MILSENGWSDRFAGIAGTSQEDADAAEARWSWLSALLASRDIAACVIEVIRDPGRTDYRIVALSPGFVEATGLVNAAGRCMRDLKPDHEQFWFDLYQRVADTGEPATFDHPSQALNRRFRGHAFRIGFPGAWRVVVILENSPSMTTKDGAEPPLESFSATLAHELRAPLAPLRNGLHILKQATGQNQDIRWTFAMMERQFDRLAELIDDLLDVGRLGSVDVHMERERVNIHHVISDSIEACAAAIDARQHEVKIEADGTGLLVRGDRRRLTQVFTNLLTNSIKYTAPGGHIRIRLSSAEGSAIVEVADDGLGISADDLPHVFDLFSQGRMRQYQSNGGLGIGLSIVRTIVRLHGGNVSAHSEGPGKGSTFIVRLPLSP